ncbi:MAG TPA: ROK family protein [Thermodesulfobacteriota bacterium]
MRYAVGVDLGGTNTRLALVSDAGIAGARLRHHTEVSRGREHVLGRMADAILRLARDVPAGGRLVGVGVGVPGVVDQAGGAVVASANFPGWRDVPIAAELTRRTGLRVSLENDANAAAVGEGCVGAGRPYDSFVLLTLGTGIGSGIVLDGRLWRGAQGMAGEAGHVTIDSSDTAVPCGCGNRGCAERYASATAVARMAREAGLDGNLDARAVARLAQTGEGPEAEVARGVYRRAGRALGILAATLVNILNPRAILVGGGMSEAWDLIEPPLRAELLARAHRPMGETTVLARAALGDDAGILGAASLVLGGT